MVLYVERRGISYILSRHVACIDMTSSLVCAKTSFYLTSQPPVEGPSLCNAISRSIPAHEHGHPAPIIPHQLPLPVITRRAEPPQRPRPHLGRTRPAGGLEPAPHRPRVVRAVQLEVVVVGQILQRAARPPLLRAGGPAVAQVGPAGDDDGGVEVRGPTGGLVLLEPRLDQELCRASDASCQGAAGGARGRHAGRVAGGDVLEGALADGEEVEAVGDVRAGRVVGRVVLAAGQGEDLLALGAARADEVPAGHLHEELVPVHDEARLVRPLGGGGPVAEEGLPGAVQGLERDAVGWAEAVCAHCQLREGEGEGAVEGQAHLGDEDLAHAFDHRLLSVRLAEAFVPGVSPPVVNGTFEAQEMIWHAVIQVLEERDLLWLVLGRIQRRPELASDESGCLTIRYGEGSRSGWLQEASDIDPEFGGKMSDEAFEVCFGIKFRIKRRLRARVVRTLCRENRRSLIRSRFKRDAAG